MTTSPQGNHSLTHPLTTEGAEKVFLLREAERTQEAEKRRDTEDRKADSGKKHFAAFGLTFKVTSSLQHVLVD
jgi:restriction endonuclease